MQRIFHSFLLLSLMLLCSHSKADDKKTDCTSDDKCGPAEICDYDKKCEDLCGPTRCGDNSVCRVDKKRRIMYCSCKDGYIPKTDKGCVPKTASDEEIPIKEFAEILNDKCGGQCGYNAYCGPKNTCVCTTDYVGNPFEECSLIQPARSGPCDPNPCGGLSECKVVNNKAECSCKEGFGTPPYCSKCHIKIDCYPDKTCGEGGRCVKDVCLPFCGEGVNCNIFDGKLECNCEVQAINDQSFPFKLCPLIVFSPAG